jgi:hypothetical protein
VPRLVPRQRHGEADATGDRGLGERDRDPALRAVVRALEQVVAGGPDQQPMEPAFAFEIERGGAPRHRAEHHLGELAPPELGEGLAEQVDPRSVARERAPDRQSVVLDQPEHPDHRRGPDRGRAGLVVEAHVPAGDRGLERTAGVRDPSHRLRELPHHLGPLGVGEVQAVRDRERRRTGAGDVARRLGDRVRGAKVGIERAEPALAVRRQRDRLHGPVDPDERRVRPGRHHRPALHDRVVLLPHPALARHVRRAEDREERLVGRRGHGSERRVVGDRVLDVGGSRRRARVDRSLVGEGSGGDVGDRGAAERRAEGAASDEPADDRGREPPPLAHGHDVAEPIGVHDREHPLLRLAGQDLPRVQAGLAEWDRAQVELGAQPGPGRGLAHGARDPRPAQVLEPLEEAAFDELERGLDQELLRERIADLHARSVFLGPVVQSCGRQHRHPADAVATGGRAEQDEQRALVDLPARRDEHLGRRDADAHHVHGGVRRMGRRELHLAAHGWDADAVAVAADPGHHALEQPSVPLLVERAETKWVEQRDRPGPHRDHVAHDPADPGRGALVRLDRRGMRVGLELEHGRDPVAHIDRAGVLTRADEHRATLGGQAAQVDLRGLVGAVLGPHHGVHRELVAVGIAAERRTDRSELVVGESELAVQRL